MSYLRIWDNHFTKCWSTRIYLPLFYGIRPVSGRLSHPIPFPFQALGPCLESSFDIPPRSLPLTSPPPFWKHCTRVPVDEPCGLATLGYQTLDK